MTARPPGGHAAGEVHLDDDALAAKIAAMADHERSSAAWSTRTGPDTLRLLARHPEARCGVAANIQTPLDVLIDLAADPDAGVRGAAATNPALSGPLQTQLARDKTITVRMKLAARTGVMDAQAAALLGWDKSIRVRRNLVRNTHPLVSPLPVEALDGLVSPQAPAEIRKAAATRPDLTADHLATLLKDTAWHVRLAAAQTLAHRPPDFFTHEAEAPLVDLVSRDRAIPVRAALAAATRADLSPEVLTRLLTDPAPRVRIAMACRHALPVDIQERLAADPDPTVRAALAANDRIPSDVLRRLLADPDPAVAQAAGDRFLGAFAAAR